MVALKGAIIGSSAAVLVLGAWWLLAQHERISSLEDETVALEAAVAAAGSPDGKSQRPEGTRSDDPGASGQDMIPEFDWQELARERARRMRPDGEVIERFLGTLDGLTLSQLVAVLDEIGSLDLPRAQRTSLAMMVLPSLQRKDPKLALDRFVAPEFAADWANIGTNGYLHAALAIWARTDPAGACDWLDRKLADGWFESKALNGIDQARVGFEQALAKVLWKSDSDQIARRLIEMSEEEAHRVVSSLWTTGIEEEHWTTYADLVRAALPELSRNQVLANFASNRAKDYAEASRFLDVIQASPAERESAADHVALSRILRVAGEEPLTVEYMDALRAWAGDQHPDVDRMTGRALSEAICNVFGFDEAAEMVIHYQEETGRDEVLLAFLAGDARIHVSAARKLAERISDPAARAQVLETIR